MTPLIVKEGSGTFRGLPTDVKFTIKINQLCKVNTRFRDPHAGSVQILPLIYFSCGGIAGNVNVKKLNVWVFKWFVFELRRIISNQKWANVWLVLRYIGLGWFLIMDIFGETVAYFKALRRDTSIFSQRGRRCASKGERCLVTTYIEDGTWA